MANKPTFHLSRATPDDVLILSQIVDRAFANDTHTQFKEAHRPEGSTSFQAGMAEGIKQWMGVPDRCVVLKAVDDRDGSIAGCITWAFRGVAMDPVPEEAIVARRPIAKEGLGQPPPTATDAAASSAVGGDDDSAIPPSSSSSSKGPPQSSETKLEPKRKARLEELEHKTTTHLSAFQARIMPPGTRCLFLIATAVDPAYQGQGVGSLLLRWGTEQADRAGVFCWVHASEAGWRVFGRHGFGEVERLTVVLDEWVVPAEEGEEMGGGGGGGDGEGDGKGKGIVWGDYTFRYMVRQPLTSQVGVHEIAEEELT